MGGMTLELITSLLYGYDKLEDFNRSIRSNGDHSRPYSICIIQIAILQKVHPTVTRCIG